MRKITLKMYGINLILVLIGFICSLFNITVILLPIFGAVSILGMLSNALAIIRQHIFGDRIEIAAAFDFVAFTLLFMLLIYDVTGVVTMIMMGVINCLFILSSLFRIFNMSDDNNDDKKVKELVIKSL